MAVVTDHAKKRMAERANISSRNDIKRNTSKAWKRGIKHKEAHGELKKWMDKLFLKYKKASDMRVYKNNIYIFNNGILITMFPVPDHLLPLSETDMSPQAYARYLDIQKEYSNKNAAKKKKKYEERRSQFLEKVMLNDVLEFLSETDVTIEIVSVKFIKDTISINYIPQDDAYIEFTPLKEYISDTTGKNVKITHIKGLDRRPMYKQKSHTDDTKHLYVPIIIDK